MKRVTSDGSEAVTLLVEDNPGDVRLFQEVTSEAGVKFSAHVVTSGRDAIDFVHQRGEYADAPQPDILLLDWFLPVTDGERVLRELDDAGQLSELFVLVLTGLEIDGDSLVPSDLCVDGHLEKPIDIGEFLSLVRSSERLSVTHS